MEKDNSRPRLHLISSKKGAKTDPTKDDLKNDPKNNPKNDTIKVSEFEKDPVFEKLINDLNKPVFPQIPKGYELAHYNPPEINKNLIIMQKAYSNFLDESYHCHFCNTSGHHPGDCPKKKNLDKIFRKDPLLSREWGAYKFQHIDVESKKKKKEVQMLKTREREINAIKAMHKLNKEKEKLELISKQIQAREEAKRITINPPITSSFLNKYLDVTPPKSKSSSDDMNVETKSISSLLPPSEEKQTLVENKAKKHVIIQSDVAFNYSCCLCQFQFKLNEMVTNISCRHFTHWDCLLLRCTPNSKPLCPVCSIPITIIE
jgi:hypothetical protein